MADHRGTSKSITNWANFEELPFLQNLSEEILQTWGEMEEYESCLHPELHSINGWWQMDACFDLWLPPLHKQSFFWQAVAAFRGLNEVINSLFASMVQGSHTVAMVWWHLSEPDNTCRTTGRQFSEGEREQMDLTYFPPQEGFLSTVTTIYHSFCVRVFSCTPQLSNYSQQTSEWSANKYLVSVFSNGKIIIKGLPITQNCTRMNCAYVSLCVSVIFFDQRRACKITSAWFNSVGMRHQLNWTQ